MYNKYREEAELNHYRAEYALSELGQEEACKFYYEEISAYVKYVSGYLGLDTDNINKNNSIQDSYKKICAVMGVDCDKLCLSAAAQIDSLVCGEHDGSAKEMQAAVKFLNKTLGYHHRNYITSKRQKTAVRDSNIFS